MHFIKKKIEKKENEIIGFFKRTKFIFFWVRRMKVGNNWARYEPNVIAQFKKRNDDYNSLIDDEDMAEIVLTIEKSEDKNPKGSLNTQNGRENSVKNTANDKAPSSQQRIHYGQSNVDKKEQFCWDTLLFISTCAATIIPLVLLYYFFKAIFLCNTVNMHNQVVCGFNGTNGTEWNQTYPYLT